MDLVKVKIPWIQLLVDLLVGYGLIDLVRHFRQRRRFRNLNTWSQVRQGTALWSICEYILGTDQRRFELVGIRDMRKFLSDHFVLRARLLQSPTRCHTMYLWGRRTVPLRLPPTAELRRAGAKVHTLKALEPVPPSLNAPLYPSGYPHTLSG